MEKRADLFLEKTIKLFSFGYDAALFFHSFCFKQVLLLIVTTTYIIRSNSTRTHLYKFGRIFVVFVFWTLFSQHCLRFVLVAVPF